MGGERAEGREREAQRRGELEKDERLIDWDGEEVDKKIGRGG